MSLQPASVERKASCELEIRWPLALLPGPVSIFWSRDPEVFDTDKKPLATVEAGGRVTLADPSPGQRPYFLLVPGTAGEAGVNPSSGSGLVAAERRLPLEGEVNFRDLGGYCCRDGRRVKWGRLYRSGELGRLSEADLAYLASLSIKTVCDLRVTYEVEQLPDRLPPGAVRLPLPISGGELPMQAVYQAVRSGDLAQLDEDHLVRGNRLFVREFTPAYAAMLQRITAEDGRPSLIHCTAGKDRAGLGSAILLWILGVPNETVMADYLLTNHYRADLTKRMLTQVAQVVSAAQNVPLEAVDLSPLEALMVARPAYLGAAVETIMELYGSIEGYIHEGLGMSPAARAKFQDKLLD